MSRDAMFHSLRRILEASTARRQATAHRANLRLWVDRQRYTNRVSGFSI